MSRNCLSERVNLLNQMAIFESSFLCRFFHFERFNFIGVPIEIFEHLLWKRNFKICSFLSLIAIFAITGKVKNLSNVEKPVYSDRRRPTNCWWWNWNVRNAEIIIQPSVRERTNANIYFDFWKWKGKLEWEQFKPYKISVTSLCVNAQKLFSVRTFPTFEIALSRCSSKLFMSWIEWCKMHPSWIQSVVRGIFYLFFQTNSKCNDKM